MSELRGVGRGGKQEGTYSSSDEVFCAMVCVRLKHVSWQWVGRGQYVIEEVQG